MSRVFRIRTVDTDDIKTATVFDFFVDGKPKNLLRAEGGGSGLHYYYKFMWVLIKEKGFRRHTANRYVIKGPGNKKGEFPRSKIPDIIAAWDVYFKNTTLEIIDAADGGGRLRQYHLVSNDNIDKNEYIFQLNDEVYAVSGTRIERVYNYLENVLDYAPVKDFCSDPEVEQTLFPRVTMNGKTFGSLTSYFFENKESENYKLFYISSQRRFGKTYSLCDIAKRTASEDMSYSTVFLSVPVDFAKAGEPNLAQAVFRKSKYLLDLDNDATLSFLDAYIRRSPAPWLLLLDDFDVLSIEKQRQLLHSLGVLLKDNDNVKVIITSSIPIMFDRLDWDEELITEQTGEKFTLRSVTARGHLLKLAPEQIPAEIRHNRLLHPEFCTPELCAFIKNHPQDLEVSDYYGVFEIQGRELNKRDKDNRFYQALQFLAFNFRNKETIGNSFFNSIRRNAEEYTSVLEIEDYSKIRENLISSGELISVGNNLYKFRRYEFSKYLAAKFFVDYILSFEAGEAVANVLENEVRSVIHDILPHTGRAYQDFSKEDWEQVSTRMNSFLYAEFLFVELYKGIFAYSDTDALPSENQDVISYLANNDALRSYILLLGLFIGFDKGLKAWNYTLPLVKEFLKSDVKYMDTLQVLNACIYTCIRQTNDIETLNTFGEIYDSIISIDFTMPQCSYPYLMSEEESGDFRYHPRLLEALLYGNIGGLELQRAKLIRDGNLQGSIDDELSHYHSAEKYHQKGLSIKRSLASEAVTTASLGVIRSYISLATDLYWLGVAECRNGNNAGAIQYFENACKKYDDALALDERPVEDAEPFVLHRRKAGCCLEMFKLTDQRGKKDEYADMILACLKESCRSLYYYVSLDGEINLVALERQRNEIERFVTDLRTKYSKCKYLQYLRDKRGHFDFSFVNDLLRLYNQLNYYNPLFFDETTLDISD